MKDRGILETRRGGVRVTQAGGLESIACGCNRAVRSHFDDVLRGVYPVEEESAAIKVRAGDLQPGSRMPG